MPDKQDDLKQQLQAANQKGMGLMKKLLDALKKGLEKTGNPSHQAEANQLDQMGKNMAGPEMQQKMGQHVNDPNSPMHGSDPEKMKQHQEMFAEVQRNMQQVQQLQQQLNQVSAAPAQPGAKSAPTPMPKGPRPKPTGPKSKQVDQMQQQLQQQQKMQQPNQPKMAFDGPGLDGSKMYTTDMDMDKVKEHYNKMMGGKGKIEEREIDGQKVTVFHFDNKEDADKFLKEINAKEYTPGNDSSPAPKPDQKEQEDVAGAENRRAATSVQNDRTQKDNAASDVFDSGPTVNGEPPDRPSSRRDASVTAGRGAAPQPSPTSSLPNPTDISGGPGRD